MCLIVPRGERRLMDGKLGSLVLGSFLLIVLCQLHIFHTELFCSPQTSVSENMVIRGHSAPQQKQFPSDGLAPIGSFRSSQLLQVRGQAHFITVPAVSMYINRKEEVTEREGQSTDRTSIHSISEESPSHHWLFY